MKTLDSLHVHTAPNASGAPVAPQATPYHFTARPAWLAIGLCLIVTVASATKARANEAHDASQPADATHATEHHHAHEGDHADHDPAHDHEHGHEHDAGDAPGQDNHEGHAHEDHDQAHTDADHDHADHDQADHGHKDEHDHSENDHGHSEDDHDHADHDHDHDHDHANHDHDEGVVRLDAATLEEFGIVVDEAGPGTLTEVVALPGEVVFNADRYAHVTPGVPGIVRGVSASVGDRVSAGQTLALLSSRELAAARSEYLAARARLELASEVLDRDQRSLADRIGTERQVLASRQAVREAEIALNLAEQNLHALGEGHGAIERLTELPDTELALYALKSPLDGLVIDRHLTRGERVDEAGGDAPFVVADLTSVWVNLTVYQRDLSDIHAGQRVAIAFGPGLPEAQGEIAFVSPALEERTRTATARVVLDNPEGLWRPGLFVTGRVRTDTMSAAVVIPLSAVTEVDGQPSVFVQTEAGFEARAVELGRSDREHVRVLSGLRAGERYVSRNTLAIKAELNRAALEHAGHVH